MKPVKICYLPKKDSQVSFADAQIGECFIRTYDTYIWIKTNWSVDDDTKQNAFCFETTCIGLLDLKEKVELVDAELIIYNQ